MRSKPQVESLLPVTLPGGVHYAPGVRAGRWVFATGHKGTAGFSGCMAPEVIDSAAPRHGAPKHKKEARRIFANLDQILAAGGAERSHAVRIDQYYANVRAVDPYHEVRREFFAGHIPPSTSNLHRRFLLPGQDIEVQLIAAAAEEGFEPLQHRPAGLPVHASSGYSPVVTCGDFVFVAGQTAEALDSGNGPLDPEACMPSGHLWKGTPIKLETEFVIRRKLKPALESVGNTLAEVVKAQVYLRDVDDIPAFNEVWAAHFGNSPPATSIVTTATPGFICEASRIEINTISVRRGGATKKESVEAEVPMPYAGQVQAVRAGELLFLSNLMAVDASGALAAGADARQQVDHMLAAAERLCHKAGTTLANVVRVQQFHTDLAHFDDALIAWQHRLPGHFLPFSAIEVPALAVPGAVVMLDLWVYVPR
jgi:enamine deaminase RidA (YjgF/YER057c/UK114 family)